MRCRCRPRRIESKGYRNPRCATTHPRPRSAGFSSSTRYALDAPGSRSASLSLSLPRLIFSKRRSGATGWRTGTQTWQLARRNPHRSNDRFRSLRPFEPTTACCCVALRRDSVAVGVRMFEKRDFGIQTDRGGSGWFVPWLE